MRIAHFIPSLGVNGGGPPRSVSQLCSNLCDRGEIHLISRKTTSPLIELDRRISLSLLPKKKRPILRLRLGSEVYSTLCDLHAKFSFHLVHQHGIWLGDSHQTTRFATRNRLPLVLSPRGMMEPWALNFHRYKKIPAWYLYQKNDLLHASAFHATALSEAENIRRLGFKQPIAILPNAVNIPSSPIQGVNWEARPSPKDPRPRCALFLSRINPKKGLPMLLDAWAKVAPKDWRLVIAGNDDSGHLPLIEGKIRALALQDRVEIVGPLLGEAKEKAFLGADLFLLPSYSENFGIVVIEALSYHVPVLTTTGCPWEELRRHDCGWWVDPTPHGIEEGLRAALGTSASTLAEMGLRGRRLVEGKYQWPAIAEKFMLFYEWLLGSGDRPDFVLD